MDGMGYHPQSDDNLWLWKPHFYVDLAVHIALLTAGIRAICSSTDAALTKGSPELLRGLNHCITPLKEASGHGLFHFVPFQQDLCRWIGKKSNHRAVNLIFSIRTLKSRVIKAMPFEILRSHVWPRDFETKKWMSSHQEHDQNRPDIFKKCNPFLNFRVEYGWILLTTENPAICRFWGAVQRVRGPGVFATPSPRQFADDSADAPLVLSQSRRRTNLYSRRARRRQQEKILDLVKQ